ncbi:MAG: nitrile hydratase accessory protein [Paracoccaceae bacterium]|jgi:nitrile hydratase accessory protein|nr:nitrile hydratase accessory protein [Marinovum sp.]MDG1424615.1 nitrile hydratase accessory protein [Paracoccaceae bacterium]MDG2232027.1 nitrile hydratase accessory protein [Paracoccaceae bacterium]
MQNAPQPVFEHPWHAQLFALSVALHAQGLFSWPDWTKRFGARLKRNGAERDLNGGDDYFTAWLETLEELLVEREPENRQQLSALRTAWKQAYLSTPHGSPVTIKFKK